MDEPIFDRDGDRFVATALARGPWDPGSCHGGAPAALLASLVDAVPSAQPMQCVRLTYEIERPVPLNVPLDSHTEVTRDGRRVQVVDSRLATADGTTLVRCRAVRIRVGDVAIPVDASEDLAAPEPSPDGLPRYVGTDAWKVEGFWSAVDLRIADGKLGEVGPGLAWTNLVCPIAEELDTTPLARAAAAGDFGNGVGSPLPMDRYLYINPDLTVALHRLPDGPWVGIQAASVAQPSGVGLTSSTLSDTRGRIGTASQSLFVDARPDPSPSAAP